MCHYALNTSEQRSKQLITPCVIDKLVVANKGIVVAVKSKREFTNNTFWSNITTLICQNKFIYGEQYNVLFLFVK